MHLRLRESSVLSQYCDFCPNHPLQPFPLVVFCVVFFFKQIKQYCDNTLDSRRRRMTSIDTGYNSVTGKNAIAIIYVQVSRVT